jgi:hypothetical protein
MIKASTWLQRTLIAALLALLTATAGAQDSAVSVHVSADGGAGAELTTRLADSFNARLAYHQASYRYTDPSNLVTYGDPTTNPSGPTRSNSFYDHHGKQKIWSVMLDWYTDPDSQFHYRFGLSYNDHQDNIVGHEALWGGGYDIGNAVYTATQVGKLQGIIRSNRFAPYLGYGWGNPVLKNKQWGWLVDAGLMYQGKPDITLTANSAVLSNDLEAEKARLLGPSCAPVKLLLSVGVSYQW